MHYPKSMCEKAKGGDKESIALILLEAPDMPLDMKMKPEDYAMKMIDDNEEPSEDMNDEEAFSSATEDDSSESSSMSDNPFIDILNGLGLPESAVEKISMKLMEAKEAGKI